MSVTHFDHVTVVTHDVLAATEDFAALLGFGPVWRGEHAELGTEAALFGVGNALIELTGPRGGAPEAEGMRLLLQTRGEGLLAMAFGAEDAAACSAMLRKSGVRAAPPADGEALASDGARRTFRVVELSPRSTRGLSVLVVERSDLETLRRVREPSTDTACALDHVVVRTSNPDQAVALYSQALGLRLALDTSAHGPRMLFFRVGGVTLEVIEDPGIGEQDVFYGLCYRVPDLDAAHRRLTRMGFSVGEPRDGKKPGTRVFTVRNRTAGVPTLVLHDPARGD